MAYDARIGSSVMTPAPSNGSMVPTPIEASTYDGVAWASLPLLESRVVAHEHSLVQPAGSASLFVFDGASAQELVHRPPLVETVGSACDALAPQLGARAWPGPGNAGFGIDVVGAPPLAVVLGVTNAAGFASRVIPVPPQPALLSVQCYFQAAVLQPTSIGGLSLSAGLRIVVGE